MYIQNELRSNKVVELIGSGVRANGDYCSLLEYCNGGDLRLLLKKRNNKLNEEETRVLVQKMVIGLNHTVR